MNNVRRFRHIGGFKDDVLYIEHVDGESYGIIKEDFSNAYPLESCERLVKSGDWEEIPDTTRELLDCLEFLAKYMKGDLWEGGWTNYPEKPTITPADMVREVIAKAKGEM